ncbi:MAG: permease [Candidatus Micrarchaeota archaeon]|nr:permease [Candidatus Micrarchaeota archaeon]
MDPLQSLADAIVYGLLGLPPSGLLAGMLDYFIYDSLKVLLLLTAMIFLVSVLRTFVSRERVRQWLGGRREGVGNVLAALLGIPTPFCSCSAVPLFIGFVRAGVPLGVTFSFLVASPMINEVALALLFALFGWPVALLYVITGLAVAVLAGLLIGRLRLEGELEPLDAREAKLYFKKVKMGWGQRMEFAKGQTAHLVSTVGPYVLAGVGLGALIHGLAPVDWLSGVAGRGNPFGVVIAVLVGVPLYSNAAGVIPIVQALIGKGMAMGTALAFMMSVTALSLPEMMILRRVMKPKLLAAFIAILAVSFVLVGLLFNAVLG